MPRTAPVRSALTSLVLMASLAACSDDDPTLEPEATDIAAFCATAPDPSVTVPESYVGSAEHVEELRQLRTTAPAELRDDLDRLVQHFDDEVDPAVPDSQLTENFPADVNDAVGRVTAYLGEHCID